MIEYNVKNNIIFYVQLILSLTRTFLWYVNTDIEVYVMITFGNANPNTKMYITYDDPSLESHAGAQL